MKKLIEQDKDLYRKMDIRVKHVETTLGKTATEFREIKQSHFSLVEKVQRIQDEMQLSDFGSKKTEQRKKDMDILKEENDSLKVCLKEKVEELDDLRIKNKELVQQISTVPKTKSEIQDNTKLFAAEAAIKVLVGKNEKLNEEIKQLKNELKRPNQNEIGTECTNRACKSTIAALEYDVEQLSSKKDLAATCHALEDRNIALEAKLTVSINETEEINSLMEEQKHDIHMEQKKIQELNSLITTFASEKIVQQEMYMVAKAGFEKQIKNLKYDNSINLSYAQSTITLLNEQTALLQNELTRKEEECELLKKRLAQLQDFLHAGWPIT